MLVADGIEGVDAILTTDFDIVVCDTQLPSLPGEMLYKSVTRMRPQLADRFIFVTAAGARHHLSEAISAAAIAVLSKPIDLDDLLDLVAYSDLRLGER
jgi:DNA-binding NarL/FixJ family response regulator